MKTATALASIPELTSLAEEVELFCDGEQKQVLISFFTFHTRTAALKTTSLKIQALVSELAGTAVFHARKKELVDSWGEQALTYKVGGNHYHVSIGSFFQTNRFLVDELLQCVTQGKSGRVAWDLYAGVGLFAKQLAKNFSEVIAVEASTSSSRDLGRNLLLPHTCIHTSTMNFLRETSKHSQPDLVIVDPPRAGMGLEVSKLLASVASPEIVYVSCDPTTLVRDLSVLVQHGYKLKKISLVDLFPQTFHLETVSVLARA